MSNQETSSKLATATAGVFNTSLLGVVIVAAAAAIIFMAALAPAAIALIVLGAAALLLILGAVAFHSLTCSIKAYYASNPAGAAAAYGFPTYAALKASWPWAVRIVAC